MAEEKKKSLRQKIAHLKQRVKDLLLAKNLSQKVVDKLLEVLDEVGKQWEEASRYRDEGSDDLAESLERKVRNKLDDVERQLDEEPEEEEEEEQPEEEEPKKKKQKKKGEEADKQSGPERVQDAANRIRQAQQKIRLAQKRAQQAEKTAATARATGVALKAVMSNPYFWIVVLIALIIVIVIALFFQFGGVAHKAFNEGGGSFPIEMEYENPEHQVLAGEVMRLKNNGILVFEDGLEKDIEWREADGRMTMNLDWRIMATLKYLGEKWEKRDGVIGIKISTSNGPSATRRKAAIKIAGIALADQTEEPLDAQSAYEAGQGLGISQIGRISNGLAKTCFKDNDGDMKNNAPVQVSWQEVASQHIIRPIYEQLQVDSKVVYEGGAALFGIAKQADKSEVYRNQMEALVDDPETWFGKVGNALDLMINNLGIMLTQGLDSGIHAQTVVYAEDALEKLKAVREKTRGRVLEWKDEELMQTLHDGLQMTFRMMQVANMVGWQGSRKNKCRLWKAYEARQNIRQLVLDLERMPAELATAPNDWNSDLMVRQLIVYSPEDDLDNGVADLDVFPNGAVAVAEGGVGFDDTDKDGVVDEKDWHFMDLPIDNGVFSKAATIFVYTDDSWLGRAGDIQLDVALNSATLGGYAVLDGMHDIFSGTGISVLSGEKTEKVTYKNFVHVGF